MPAAGLHPSLFSAATHGDGGVGVGVGLGLVPLQNSRTEKGVQPAAVRSFLCSCPHCSHPSTPCDGEQRSFSNAATQRAVGVGPG